MASARRNAGSNTPSNTIGRIPQESSRKNKLLFPYFEYQFMKPLFLVLTILVFFSCCIETQNIESKNEIEAACMEFDDESLRAKCIGTQARATNNINLCEEIKLADYKARCLSALAGQTGNLSVCDHVRVDVYHDECIKNVAAHNKDFELCNTIKRESIKTACQLGSRK